MKDRFRKIPLIWENFEKVATDKCQIAFDPSPGAAGYVCIPSRLTYTENETPYIYIADALEINATGHIYIRPTYDVRIEQISIEWPNFSRKGASEHLFQTCRTVGIIERELYHIAMKDERACPEGIDLDIKMANRSTVKKAIAELMACPENLQFCKQVTLQKRHKSLPAAVSIGKKTADDEIFHFIKGYLGIPGSDSKGLKILAKDSKHWPSAMALILASKNV